MSFILTLGIDKFRVEFVSKIFTPNVGLLLYALLKKPVSLLKKFYSVLLLCNIIHDSDQPCPLHFFSPHTLLICVITLCVHTKTQTLTHNVVIQRYVYTKNASLFKFLSNCNVSPETYSTYYPSGPETSGGSYLVWTPEVSLGAGVYALGDYQEPDRLRCLNIRTIE